MGIYDWENYDDEYDTGYWAAFVNDTHIMGNLTFNAGIRYDDNEDSGSQVSPSGGVVYSFFNKKARIRAQAARGFSAPPAAWVDDPVYGNPGLKPETATNYQVGGEKQVFKFLRFDLNFFYADVKDLIRFDLDTWQYENIDEAVRRGVEGSLTAAFDFGLTLGFGGSYVDVRDEETDDVIRDIPRTLYNASALYTYGPMTHALLGRYIDHNSTYDETKDKKFIFDYTFKFALPFPKTYGKTSLYATIYNLFNTTYLYREVFPKPDRWVEAGTRFTY